MSVPWLSADRVVRVKRSVLRSAALLQLRVEKGGETEDGRTQIFSGTFLCSTQHPYLVLEASNKSLSVIATQQITASTQHLHCVCSHCSSTEPLFPLTPA